MKQNKQTKPSKLNRIALGYKILLGVVEVVFGLGLLLLEVQIISLYQQATNAEVSEDPSDFFVVLSNKYIPYLITHRYYIAILFLILGLAKIVGGLGMWYGKDWARHVLIGFLVAFLPYDMLSFIHDPSQFTLGYLLLNVILAFYFMDFRPLSYAKEVGNIIRSKSPI